MNDVNSNRNLDMAVDLLRQLVGVKSISRMEEDAAKTVRNFLHDQGIETIDIANNTVALSRHFDPSRPTLMLNSHIDTVKPSPAYTFDPFCATLENGRILGLGSNDAGASGVSLAVTFLDLMDRDLPFNLLLALSAEEEVGGEHGMRYLIPELEKMGIHIDMAIVGEPTGLQPAYAERGLIVLDCVTRGVTGHAARNEGLNAIYRAMTDIDTLRNYRFPETSRVLGPVKISITQIEAGRQHNVVPDECRWVVDIRTTDAYSNKQTADMLQAAVSEHSTLTPRSTRVHASVLGEDHPLMSACRELGLEPFVSPTTSDMSQLHDIPSLKIGPGQSSRSHSADEYVEVAEIQEALQLYPRLIMQLADKLTNKQVN